MIEVRAKQGGDWSTGALGDGEGVIAVWGGRGWRCAWYRAERMGRLCDGIQFLDQISKDCVIRSEGSKNDVMFLACRGLN